MRIGAFDLDERVLVVAEIGNNHEGDFEVAKELVRRAADAGADAVKTQVIRAERFVTHGDQARFDQIKSFELTYEQVSELGELAGSLGVLFLSSVFDLDSVQRLDPVVDAFKVASGDVDFLPLLTKIAETGKPTILSSGASELAEVEDAVAAVQGCWHERGTAGELAVLHCVSRYPTPPAEANLRSIPFLAKRLGVTVGYSDHVLGIEASTLAVALGARIVEKHFTIDKAFSEYRDHALSADPAEFRELVEAIRDAERMLGQEGKQVQPVEAGERAKLRRSITAARDLARGHHVDSADLTWLRPGGGLAPGNEGLLVGRRLHRDVLAGEQLKADDVE